MLDGIYTWADGVKARAAIHGDKIIFGLPLIFPEDDFRQEYYGAIKNGIILTDDKDEYNKEYYGYVTEEHILHGHGTLTLKNGMGSFRGEWDNGMMKDHEEDLRKVEEEWKAIKQEEKEEQEKFRNVIKNCKDQERDLQLDEYRQKGEWKLFLDYL